MSNEVMRIQISREKAEALNAWAKENGYRQTAATDRAVDTLLKSTRKGRRK